MREEVFAQSLSYFLPITQLFSFNVLLALSAFVSSRSQTDWVTDHILASNDYENKIIKIKRLLYHILFGWFNSLYLLTEYHSWISALCIKVVVNSSSSPVSPLLHSMCVDLARGAQSKFCGTLLKVYNSLFINHLFQCDLFFSSCFWCFNVVLLPLVSVCPFHALFQYLTVKRCVDDVNHLAVRNTFWKIGLKICSDLDTDSFSS